MQFDVKTRSYAAALAALFLIALGNPLYAATATTTMTVQMTIPIARAADAVAVPVSAVFKGSGNSRVVYVRKGMKTERRPVKIGVSNTEHAQILQGLQLGEEILLTEPERIAKRG